VASLALTSEHIGSEPPQITRTVEAIHVFANEVL